MELGNGSGPLWQQVVSLIRRNIEEGVWRPEQQIPSERELCETYGISRTTVRLAIAEAVNAGLISRVHGKGTFVSSPKIKQPLVRFTSFAETMESQGLTPGTSLLEFRLQPASIATARLLQLPVGADVIRIWVLGLGDGEPMSLYDSEVPADLGASLQPDLERHERRDRFYLVNTLLAERNGWQFLKAEQTFEAAPATSEESRLLRLSRGAPVLRVDSLFENPQGRPVEFRRATYRADKYQFHVTRQMFFHGGGG